jgi:hypothetical protein
MNAVVRDLILIAYDKNLLADKASLQFVMKDGMIAASHAGSELPKELFAKQVLKIKQNI